MRIRGLGYTTLFVFSVATAVRAQESVINACYDLNKGDLRRVASPADCTAKELPLTWNITGPQGPAGPQGATGLQGPVGPQGPAGTAAPLVHNGTLSGDGTSAAPLQIASPLALPGALSASGPVTAGNSSTGGILTATNTVNRWVEVGSNLGFDSISGTCVGLRLRSTFPIEADSYGIILGSNVFPGQFIIRKDDLSLPSFERNRFVIAGNGDVIVSPGNLGLGVPVPSARLDVAGNARISGDLIVLGAKSSAVPLSDHRRVRLYAVESPENWFEDFGRAELADGTATVRLDDVFRDTIEPSDYHVFLTPEGDCAGLYVAGKTAAGFTVRELHGGRANVAFAYRIVARRKGYAGIRFPDGGGDNVAHD